MKGNALTHQWATSHCTGLFAFLQNDYAILNKTALFLSTPLIAHLRLSRKHTNRGMAKADNDTLHNGVHNIFTAQTSRQGRKMNCIGWGIAVWVVGQGTTAGVIMHIITDVRHPLA